MPAALDPARIPVLVGVGQITQRQPEPQQALGPLALMEAAARQAAEDSGAGERLLQQLDSVAVIRLFADTSHRFTSPFGGPAHAPKSLAQRLGAAAARRLVYTHPGGNMPQWCVNRLCEGIARGEVGSALVVGAEALATQRNAQRAGVALDWRDQPGGPPPEAWGVPTRGWSDDEDRHHARAAIAMYPVFEHAIRHARGRDLAAHQAHIGRLLARLAAVAAANPLADRRAGYAADEIATPGPKNPWVAHPYTRLMCANAYIDQGAALILTNVAQADRLGIPRERRVYLHGCADAHDHWYVSQRRDFHSSPAMQAVFAQAFAMAGKGLADMALLDIYSCFASAVEVACDALGLAEDDPRGLTVTGGLPYFGGPGNNYVTHSIAEMAQRLRAQPGAFGLVTANGNYLTKHAAGIWSTTPPDQPFAPEDPAVLQARLDAQVPSPPFAPQANGAAQVESYTVMHDPKAGPVQGIVFGRLLDGPQAGARFIANTPVDAGLLAAMQAEEFIGRRGRVQHGDGRNRFRSG